MFNIDVKKRLILERVVPWSNERSSMVRGVGTTGAKGPLLSSCLSIKGANIKLSFGAPLKACKKLHVLF